MQDEAPKRHGGNVKDTLHDGGTAHTPSMSSVCAMDGRAWPL